MTRLHRVGEVAEMTGVSIRTLHHYDRIGLLEPARRSEGGQRLYSETDLLKLQQVLTLRYLGFPLKRIGELLDRPDFDLVASLQAQQQALRDRAAEIGRIEKALNCLLAVRLESGEWDWTLVNRLSHTVHDQLSERGQTMERYYTPEQMARFADLREKLSDVEIRAVEEGWTELLAEVRDSSHLDPASPEAQDLARRWDEMLERTRRGYEGYEDLWEAIGQNYSDGNFEEHEQAPNQADFAFIQRARNAAQSDRSA